MQPRVSSSDDETGLCKAVFKWRLIKLPRKEEATLFYHKSEPTQNELKMDVSFMFVMLNYFKYNLQLQRKFEEYICLSDVPLIEFRN